MKRGIFWVKEHESKKPELITVSVCCDALGTPLVPVVFSGKAGTNFNHKTEWEKLPRFVTGGVPFDTFPRGRVEIKRGGTTVFLNPDLCRESIISLIIAEFELESLYASGNVKIIGDGSRHYQHRC